MIKFYTVFLKQNIIMVKKIMCREIKKLFINLRKGKPDILAIADDHEEEKLAYKQEILDHLSGYPFFPNEHEH